jgi:hypothetical protein
MGQFEKILIRILCGTKDKDIDFTDLCKVLFHFEFKERINGSHHIFYKDGLDEIINIQPNGAKLIFKKTPGMILNVLIW